MNNYPVRIGIQIQPQHADYSSIRAAAQRAEEIGADVVFNWDHFYPLFGDAAGKHFECLTMLAGLGGVHQPGGDRRARDLQLLSQP